MVAPFQNAGGEAPTLGTSLMHVSKQTAYSPLCVHTYQPQAPGTKVHQHMCCRPAAFLVKPACSHTLAPCSEHMGHQVVLANPAAYTTT